MIAGKKASYSIICIMLTFTFFHRFIIQSFAITESVKYILDLLNILLFAITILNRKISNKVFVQLFLSCYFIITVIGLTSFLILGGTWNTPFINVIFDIRNLLRFPFFLISCYNVLNKKQTEKIFRLFLRFHLLNCVYIIYQYFTLEVQAYWMRGDNLNGFFGTKTGGNQFVNVLMIVTTVIVFEKFTKREYSKKRFCFFMALNLAISILIELKFYFVEFALVSVYYIVHYIKKPTKKICVIGFCAVILIPIIYNLLIQMLYKIYPWMEGSMSLQRMISTVSSESGYTGNGDFNRLNAVRRTIEIIFGGDIIYSFFGIGLGTANLHGQFAQVYEWTHYSWMSTSYMFIETGFIGLFFYAVSLLLPYTMCNKKNIYRKMSKIGAILLIALMVYDESLKTEAVYMICFLVSTGLISKPDCREGLNKCQSMAAAM